MKKRRTVRHFKSDFVSDEDIKKIIEVARWAPSAFNTQPWEFIVIRKKEIRDKIIAALEKHGPPIINDRPDARKPTSPGSFRDAPVFILLMIDWRARVGLLGRTQDDAARVASLYNSSSANAFLYMHLAAASLGLASQWYTATSRPAAEEAIKNIIGIPSNLKIYDMMVLGYAASSPSPKIIRSLDEIVHFDYCRPGDFRKDNEVEAYARETKAWCLAEH